MGTPTKIGKAGQPVKGNLFITDIFQELELVFLALVPEKPQHLVSWEQKALEGLVPGNNLFHTFFDQGEIVRCEGRFPVKVIVEAVLDGGPDRDFHLREQLLDGAGHHVGSAMTKDLQSVRTLHRDPLEFPVFFEGPLEIDQRSVEPRRYGVAMGKGSVVFQDLANGYADRVSLRLASANLNLDHLLWL